MGLKAWLLLLNKRLALLMVQIMLALISMNIQLFRATQLLLYLKDFSASDRPIRGSKSALHHKVRYFYHGARR